MLMASRILFLPNGFYITSVKECQLYILRIVKWHLFVWQTWHLFISTNSEEIKKAIEIISNLKNVRSWVYIGSQIDIFANRKVFTPV